MTNKVQTILETVAGNVPAASTIALGQLAINSADLQIGFGKATGSQVGLTLPTAFTPLLGVRLHSATANYKIDDLVKQGGQIYKCIVAHTAQAFSLTNFVSIVSTVAKIQGLRSIWIPASLFTAWVTDDPNLSNLAISTNAQNYQVLNFDPSTARGVTYSLSLPKSWNNGSIRTDIYWSHPAATAYVTRWEMRYGSANDGETLGTDVGTSTTNFEDTGGTTDYLYIASQASAVQVKDSPADNALVQIKIIRQAGHVNDTLNVDARVHGIMVYFTDSAGDDT